MALEKHKKAVVHPANSDAETVKSVVTQHPQQLPKQQQPVQNIFQEKKKKQSPITAWLLSQYTLLVLMIAFISISTVVVIAVISLGFFGGTINNSMQSLRQSRFSIITTHIHSELTNFASLLSSAASAIENLNLDLLDFDVLRPIAWRIFRHTEDNSKLNSGVYFGNKLAQLGGFEKFEVEGSTTLVELSTYENTLVYKSIPVINMATGQVNASAVTYSLPLDPETPYSLPWFATPFNNNETFSKWSPTYTDPSLPGMMWTTFTSSFRDPVTGEFLGCLDADASTRILSVFVQEIAKDIHGDVIAIIERFSGNVIGCSDKNVTLFDGDYRSNGEDTHNHLFSSTIKVARKIYGYHFQKLIAKRLSVDNTSTIFADYSQFMYNGKKQLLNTALLSDNNGLDWVVVQAFPVSVFYTKFNESVIVIVIVTVFLLCLTAVISLIAARFFMSPLSKLMKQAADIEDLKLEEVEADLIQNMSTLTEIRSLQAAFYSMNQRLKQFKSFIPDHILAVLEQNNTMKAMSSLRSNKEKEEEKTDISSHLTNGSQSGTRTSMSSYTHVGKEGISNAFSLGLSQCVLTVMTVKVDFSHLLNTASPLHSEMTQMNKDLITAIQNTARVSQGQIVSATPSKIVVVWNAMIQTQDHRSKACHVARNCMTKIEKLKNTWSRHRFPSIDIFIGLCTGECWAGNLGNEQMKYYAALGWPIEVSEHLCIIAKQWNAPIVLADTSDLGVEAARVFTVRPLEILALKNEIIPVFELGESLNSARADEWMYELQDQEHMRRWDNYTRAYHLYQQRNHQEALEELQIYLTRYPKDPVAVTLMERIEMGKDQCQKYMTSVESLTIRLVQHDD